MLLNKRLSPLAANHSGRELSGIVLGFTPANLEDEELETSY